MITGLRQSKPLTPSPQQQAVIDEVVGGSGHVVITARAGSGKSSTLIMLLPYLQGSVFMGAFNVAIKNELEAKVAQMGLARPDLSIKTIHAAGLAAYKFGGGSKTTKVEANKLHFIIDELAQRNAEYSTYSTFIHKLTSLGKRSGIGPLVEDSDEAWLGIIDHYDVDNELPDIDDPEEEDRLISHLIGLTRVVYQTSLERCKDEIDFDDMMLAPQHFNCRFGKYDYVLADEGQDLSPIRREIAFRMLKPSGRMIFVADSFQSIYGFCGCEPDVVELMEEQLASMKPTANLPLSVTYRCAREIVKVANQWVPDLEAAPNAPAGMVRSLDLESEPCPKCFGRVDADSESDCPSCQGKGHTTSFWDEAAGLGPDDAILCRVNRPIVELAYQLLRKGIPCRIEGRDFAGSLIKLCQKWKVRELNALENHIRTYREKEAARWRKKRNEERAAGIEDKADTVLCLLDGVRSTGKTRVSDLIDKINAMFGDTDAGQKPKVLTLSSQHKSKGLQWNRVYILGFSKYQPSRWAVQPWAVQQEHNLMYVAVTRAMRELVFLNVK